MDHVEVLPPLPKPAKRVFATARNTAAVRNGFEMGGYVKEAWYSEDQMRAYAIAALSAKPEGGSGVSDKRGDHAEALAGLLAAGGADPLSQSERAALKAAIGILCADPPRSHGVVVDEAMVERALMAQYADESLYDWLLWADFHKSEIRSLVSAALVAALGEGEPNA